LGGILKGSPFNDATFCFLRFFNSVYFGRDFCGDYDGKAGSWSSGYHSGTSDLTGGSMKR